MAGTLLVPIYGLVFCFDLPLLGAAPFNWYVREVDREGGEGGRKEGREEGRRKGGRGGGRGGEI